MTINPQTYPETLGPFVLDSAPGDNLDIYARYWNEAADEHGAVFADDLAQGIQRIYSIHPASERPTTRIIWPRATA